MWQLKRQNKYNAKSTEYNGQVYHSKKEAAYAAELDLRVKAKDIRSWERQQKFEFNLIKKGKQFCLTTKSLAGKEGVHLAAYYLDFTIKHNDGSTEFVEVKSPITMTTAWRQKWRLLELVYKDKSMYHLTVIS